MTDFRSIYNEMNRKTLHGDSRWRKEVHRTDCVWEQTVVVDKWNVSRSYNPACNTTFPKLSWTPLNVRKVFINIFLQNLTIKC